MPESGPRASEDDTILLAVDLLANRLGCGPDRARAHLVRLAETYRVELTEVASAVLTIMAGGAGNHAGAGRPAVPAEEGAGGGLLADHQQSAAWIADAQAILDILPGAVAVNLPVRDADGRIVDYRIVAASPEALDLAGRRGRELVGTSMVEAYPSVVDTELWAAYEQVLATGRPREIGPFTYREMTEGIDAEAVYSVRARRFGAGLMVSWVRHDEQRRYAARLAQAERLGNLGWAEWDLVTNTVYWSDQMFEIYERDRGIGPATLDDARRYVHPDDVERAGKAIEALLSDGEPLEVTFRIRVPSGVKHVRGIFETSRDSAGRVLKAYSIVQDVTAVEVAERDRARLADVEAELAERQHRLQSEHRLLAALQQIILPVPAGVIRLLGLQVAVRYQPAEELTRVGGDWCDLVQLPGGRTLLAVGDVAGHGITAAATMARLRHALAALAVTTTDPAELLAYFNQLVCDDPAEPTATVVVARYDAKTSSVTWAQAGHPPPIVLSAGTATALSRPEGMIVGARRDSVYANSTATLATGDILLLYTDGLIERRGRTTATGWARCCERSRAPARCSWTVCSSGCSRPTQTTTRASSPCAPTYRPLSSRARTLNQEARR